MNALSLLKAAGLALLALAALPAHALPSFARQTGLDCMSCHLSWPELTPTGRQFKLNAYTLGEGRLFPVAAMLQVSRTATASPDPGAPDQFPRDRALVLQQASLFVAGKLSEHAGMFSQWSYDGVAHHSAIDNVDLRYARQLGEGGQGLLLGATLHNSPGVQDVYNTGPAWGFPFAAAAVALSPNAQTALDGLGQQVAGLGAYLLWRNTLYAELSAYRTANGAFSLLRAGTDKTSAAALKGINPYWRVALQHEWEAGTHSVMLGGFGLSVARYPDNTVASGPADRFRDLGVDAQYQYLTDRHRVSVQANLIREKEDWNATAVSNPGDTLRAFRAKATYYYQKRYGASLGYFALGGSRDDALYNSGEAITGSVGGSPQSSGWIAELNYLPRRDIRFTLQYTAYQRFNGAATNYDGFGRNARDNDTLFLLGWFMF